MEVKHENYKAADKPSYHRSLLLAHLPQLHG